MSVRPHPRATRRTAPVEVLRGLAVLAEPPSPEHPGLAEALGLSEAPTPAHYADVFLFQLYPYASVHLGPEGMMGGEAGARVAGFWRALGHEPPAEPDHLAALLGLYVSLCAREATLDGAEARLTRRSRSALLHEHLAPWVFAFLRRIRDHTAGPLGEWADLLEEVLRGEIEEMGLGESTSAEEGTSARTREGPHPSARGSDEVSTADAGGASLRDTLPVHLREAPPLPDPRAEGAAAFVPGLLAPVRSGFIITRADLARIALRLDLGLRAGERRYALEHLLAQDAPPVLAALADEADAQARLHDERVDWLGATAGFHADRARRAARLLRELATEEAER